MSHQEFSLSGDEGPGAEKGATPSVSSRDRDYDDVGSIQSESSMIFERNVEDPYSQVFSNPKLASLSRSASNANLTPYDSHDSFLDHSSVPLSRKQSNVSNSYVSHHTLENLVAPALDEGVTIVNDDSTDLESVEMIYSRRPSTIGLDMALGRTRTNSLSDAATLNATNANAQASNPRLIRTNSASQGTSVEGRPRVLRFYSYADMLSDENSAHARRPSITQSLSSTLLRQQQAGTSATTSTNTNVVDGHKYGGSPVSNLQPGSPHFSNPFLNNHGAVVGGGGGSPVVAVSVPTNSTSAMDSHRRPSNVQMPPLAVTSRHYSGSVLSRSPNTTAQAGHRGSTSPLMIPHNPNSALLRKSHFQIESSGSECSDEEDHDTSHNSSNNSASKNHDSDHDVASAGTLNTSPLNPQGLRLSRTSTQGSSFSKKLSPPPYKTRAYSNASGGSPYINNFSRSSISSANTQRLDDVLFDESLQTGTASEVLKKKLTNEI